MSRQQRQSLIYYALMGCVAFIYLVPLIWVLSTSFRTSANMFRADQWIPNPLTFEHYTDLVKYLPDLGRYVFNTLLIATLSTVGQLVSCSLAGYALARFYFRGRTIILFALLATLMVPGQVTLIPLFVLYRNLGWINTPLALIVPTFFGNAFATFFFRQYFMNIPKELEEAAALDGAGTLRTFWSVIVPVARPAFVALGTITFVSAWNGFFLPSIFLQTQQNWMLSQALRFLLGRTQSDWGAIMAGVVISSLPMVVVYALAQRYFVEGISFTGLSAT